SGRNLAKAGHLARIASLGGKASVLAGAQKKAGKAAALAGAPSKAGMVSAHRRWHVPRNILNPTCFLCVSEQRMEEDRKTRALLFCGCCGCPLEYCVCPSDEV